MTSVSQTNEERSRNPDTPVETLLQLFSRFPIQVLQNPALAQLQSRDSTFLDTFFQKKDKILNKKLRRLNIALLPSFFLEWAISQPNSDIRATIAFNPTTPLSILDQFPHDRASSVRVSVAMNPNTPSHILEQLARYDDTDEFNWNLHETIAANTNTPIHILERFIQKPTSYAKCFAIAANPKTPSYILEQLALKRKELAFAIAKHGNTPSYVLADFAKSDRENVRESVATNVNIPSKALAKLASDSHLYVRLIAARNPTMPLHKLTELARDSCPDIRESVARNANTPSNILEELARDRDRFVRRGATQNPKMPQETLEYLVRESDDWMRSVAVGNPNIPTHFLEEFAGDRNPSIRQNIAGNVKTPRLILEQLARDKNCHVRNAVAGNINTPDSILESLALKANSIVRQTIAQNLNTPAYILERLSRDQNNTIRMAIAKNPQTPIHVLQQLARDEEVCVVQALGDREPNPELASQYYPIKYEVALGTDKVTHLSNTDCIFITALDWTPSYGWYFQIIPKRILEKPEPYCDRFDSFGYLERFLNLPLGFSEFLRGKFSFPRRDPLEGRRLLIDCGFKENLRLQGNLLAKYLYSLNRQIFEHPTFSLSKSEKIEFLEGLFEKNSCFFETENIPQAILDCIFDSSNYDFQATVARNPTIPTSMLEKFVEKGIPVPQETDRNLPSREITLSDLMQMHDDFDDDDYLDDLEIIDIDDEEC